MYGVRTGASHWLRWTALGLVTILTVLTVTSDPADARRRHRRHHHVTHSYNPPSASIVVDANSGKVLQGSNADARRHPASLTKIMTLYLLFEHLEAGQLKLSSKLKVSERASEQAPTKLDLDEGATIDVDDAIKALVTKSANDVAVVVAEALAGSEDEFAKQMTRKARALGMNHTTYLNASGLPNDDQVTTARDQAILARAIQERFPTYYKYFSTKVFVYKGEAMRNHNRLLGSVDGVDGIKTGYTRASGFNLVTSVRRGSRHIVAVVMGGSSSRARDARMRDLISDYVKVASTKRTAAKIAEKSEPASDKKRYSVASAASHTKPAPQPGSTDPIRPLLVRTITVKPGHMKISANAPLAFAPTDDNSAAASPARTSPEPEKTATVPPAQAAIASSMQPAKAPAVAPVDSKPAVTAKPENALAKTIIKMAEKTPAAEPAPRKVTRSGWIIQVGAYTDEKEAKERLTLAKNEASKLLRDADSFTETFVKDDTTWYRARFAGFDKDQAVAACRYLKRKDFGCFAVRN